MADLKIDEKDKVVIRKNHKTGEFEIKELVIHDLDTAKLLKRANELLTQLKAGKLPYIETGVLKFVCSGCDSKVPGFENRPEEYYYCAKCGKWTFWKKVRE